MKKIISIIIVVALFIACNPQKKMERQCAKCPSKVETIIKDSTSIVYRDTMFTLPSDSSMVYAWLSCDSLNQVYIKQLNTLSTQGIKTVVYFKHDTLLVSSSIDTAKIILSIKDKYHLESSNATRTIDKIVYKVPWYYYAVSVLLLIIALIIGFIIGKYVTKITSIF